MELIFDTDRKLLVNGHFAELDKLEAKRGEGSRIQVRLLRDSVFYTPSTLTQFRFIVKPWGVYDTDQVCALAESFTVDTTRSCYSGRINFATNRLNELLKTDNQYPALQNMDSGQLTLMAEFAMRPSSSVPWEDRSQTVPFVLHNNVWRGVEVAPGTPSLEETGAALLMQEQIRVMLNNVTNNNGTANTLADLTGLYFDVEAEKAYRFRFLIPYDAAATTTGARFSINGPAAYRLHYRSSWPLTDLTQVQNHLAAYNAPAAAGATSLTTGGLAIIEGMLKAASTGTVIGRFASEVSGSAIIARAGASVSWVELDV